MSLSIHIASLKSQNTCWKHYSLHLTPFGAVGRSSKSEAVSWSRAVECTRHNFHLDVGENTGRSQRRLIGFGLSLCHTYRLMFSFNRSTLLKEIKMKSRKKFESNIGPNLLTISGSLYIITYITFGYLKYSAVLCKHFRGKQGCWDFFRMKSNAIYVQCSVFKPNQQHILEMLQKLKQKNGIAQRVSRLILNLHLLLFLIIFSNYIAIFKMSLNS